MNPNKNSPWKPTQHEIDDVTKRSRREALKGSVVGALAGTLVGAKRKSKLIGAAIGATAGHYAGAIAGRRQGAADVVKSRRALLQNNLAELQELVTQLTARADARDRNGNSFPGAFPQPTMPMRKSVRGMRSVTGNGVSAEAEFFKLRENLTAHYGWAITSSLSDEELTAENCERLRDQVLSRQARAAGPHASTQNDPEFERHFLASKIGEKAVAEMPDTLVHCNFLAAVRRGDLVEFGYSPDTTDFAIINRERNGEGQFVDNDLVSSQAIQRAYHPRDRKTGIENGGGALAAGAAGLGALALLKGRKAAPKVADGRAPFARRVR